MNNNHDDAERERITVMSVPPGVKDLCGTLEGGHAGYSDDQYLTALQPILSTITKRYVIETDRFRKKIEMNQVFIASTYSAIGVVGTSCLKHDPKKAKRSAKSIVTVLNDEELTRSHETTPKTILIDSSFHGYLRRCTEGNAPYNWRDRWSLGNNPQRQGGTVEPTSADVTEAIKFILDTYPQHPIPVAVKKMFLQHLQFPYPFPDEKIKPVRVQNYVYHNATMIKDAYHANGEPQPENLIAILRWRQPAHHLLGRFQNGELDQAKAYMRQFAPLLLEKARVAAPWITADVLVPLERFVTFTLSPIHNDAEISIEEWHDAALIILTIAVLIKPYTITVEVFNEKLVNIVNAGNLHPEIATDEQLVDINDCIGLFYEHAYEHANVTADFTQDIRSNLYGDLLLAMDTNGNCKPGTKIRLETNKIDDIFSLDNLRHRLHTAFPNAQSFRVFRRFIRSYLKPNGVKRELYNFIDAIKANDENPEAVDDFLTYAREILDLVLAIELRGVDIQVIQVHYTTVNDLLVIVEPDPASYEAVKARGGVGPAQDALNAIAAFIAQHIFAVDDPDHDNVVQQGQDGVDPE